MKRKLITIIAISIIITNYAILALSTKYVSLEKLQIVTHFLTLISIFYIFAQYILPLFIYQVKYDEIAIRNERIEKSGIVLGKINCGGKIKGINFNGPILQIILYPKGIIIKPLFVQGFSIGYYEIVRINESNMKLTEAIEIYHSSNIIASPITLFISRYSIIAKMIENNIHQ